MDEVTKRKGGRGWKGTARAAVKAAVAVVVLVAVGRHVAATWRDLKTKGGLPRVDPGWATAGVALYLVGLSAFAVVFWRILARSPSPVGLGAAWRAYLISHLGKYVPGKAMVVVMRAGLVAPSGARPATAAFATFYETLVMMAAGGLIAAAGGAFGDLPGVPVGLGRYGSLQVAPGLLGLALGLAFLVVVEPHVFPRLAVTASLPFPNVGREALPRFSYPFLIEGLIWSAVGWAVLGLSLWAVVRSMSPEGVPFSLWPALTAGVALATVAGFVVALPGGLGVREWVLMTTLEPVVGADRAVLSALALRLAWVVGEVLAALALGPWRPSGARAT
ncbi:MAG TPA: lysylphosphatidylglycerol synthase domain-containing protein [Isosphaeraceae bacterium]|jgi:hypothetical protein|nr:lysylphosphatidylglycerol synthase domain-containing protein [Isosphaeraceae bacterium]